jgi:hypothetical protein
MAPLQGLSRRFWFANLRDVAAELRAGAAQASLALNDYLTDFAHRTLRER